MKKSKIFLVIIILLLVGFISFGIYYFFGRSDSKTSLNLGEKQWIEKNKNTSIDISIISDTPVISYHGKGIIDDYLTALEDSTGLEFRPISYKSGDEITTPYSIKAVSEVTDNQILIYEDNYVVVTEENKKINNISEMSGLTLAVLELNLPFLKEYLVDADIKYQVYTSEVAMISDFEMYLEYKDTDIDVVDGIAVPRGMDGMVLLKTSNLSSIVSNGLYINYNINDFIVNYVLELGEEEKLNSILSKYYKTWSVNNFDTSFNKYLISNYFELKDVNASLSSKFKSKRYTYGYVENGPFDMEFEDILIGVNNVLLSDFSLMSGADISYIKYKSITEMVEAYNNGEIDFYYGISSLEHTVNTYYTVDQYDNKMVILKSIESTENYDTIYSLNEISVVANSNISTYLSNLGITLVQYDNMRLLTEDNDLPIAMDLINFNYYKAFMDDYIIVDYFDISDLSFNINLKESSSNELFAETLDFYLTFSNDNLLLSRGITQTFDVSTLPLVIKNSAIILGFVCLFFGFILVIVKFNPRNKGKLTKEDKLRFIDPLTSVKNRHFLNENIDVWDSSEIYPQSIVIVDLKNLKYINDNYGHAEGDEVISQAASILIMNQLPNTEIIRTNGNEFLIYMIDYDEKKVLTQNRKLSKELKGIKHGFGCAIGYSMINDGIKTIDDAINEATLDMRNNKEES